MKKLNKKDRNYSAKPLYLALIHKFNKYLIITNTRLVITSTRKRYTSSFLTTKKSGMKQRLLILDAETGDSKSSLPSYIIMNRGSIHVSL